jgi:hypothetical protein
MINSATKFSVWILFVALLCFVPSVFGQGAGDHRASTAPSVFLAGDHRGIAPSGGNAISRNDDGWGQGGGDGWGGWGGGGNGGGWGGGGNGGGGNGGGVPVPEGGTTLMYLALASLCCFGAMAFRARQRASVPERNN